MICTKQEEYFDLRTEIPGKGKNRKETTNYLISEIFERNKDKVLTHGQITTEYGNKWQQIKGKLPGDLQRGLRTFFDKAKLYGVVKIGRNQYKYTPILKNTTILCEKDKNRTFTTRIRNKIIEKFNRKCAYCKNDTKYVKEVIDHWIPHSDNGKTILDNGVLLCEQCNVTKKDKNPFFVPLKIIQRTIEIDKNIKERSIKNKLETIDEIDNIIKHLETYKKNLKNE